MTPEVRSSAIHIGDASDEAATNSLVNTFQSFELVLKADAMRLRKHDLPDYPSYYYLGVVMLGPMAMCTPSNFRRTLNAIYDYRADRLERRASGLMPDDKPLQY